MPYFTINSGLRGCYMPDNAYVIKADTRRELKSAIEYEANSYRDAGYIGANKKAIATIAAAAWLKRKQYELPFVLPLAQTPGNYCHGVFVSSATRADFLEYEKESGQC